MNERRTDEERLRRALHDAAAHLPPRSNNSDGQVRRRSSLSQWRRPLLIAVAALLVVAAIPLTAALFDDDGSNGSQVVVDRTDGKAQLLAALATTVGSGSYDLEFTFDIDPGAPAPVPCTQVRGLAADGAVCASAGAYQTVHVTGQGTVNTDPYAMTVASNVSSLGPVTIFVNNSTVWEFGGAGYGTNAPPNAADPAPTGDSLSGFAGLVEGTLGESQGALSMISLANNTGYLGLEAEMVQGVTTDGTGALEDGTPVTYYRVEVDITKMADAPTLSTEQRQAIGDALGVLQRAGYTNTDERVGVDDRGFIRDVTATTKFADGSSMTRHSQFSHFGCAAHVSMPNELEDNTPTGTCASTVSSATTTTTSPIPNTPTVTLPTTTTAPQSDFQGEKAAVAQMITEWGHSRLSIDARVALVEDGEALRTTIAAVNASSQVQAAKDSGTRIHSIELVGADRAIVTFDILEGDNVTLGNQTGVAVKIDGSWRLSRDTYCRIALYVQVTCPAP